MKGFAILSTILAALMGWAFYAADRAVALMQVSGTTVVQWQGTSCVAAQGAAFGNPYQMGRPSLTCDGGPVGMVHTATWNELRVSGQYIGVDPIMGANNWISCTLYVNGELVVSDHADAGDGTDVTCLQVVN